MTDFHHACHALDSHQTRTLRARYMDDFEVIARLYDTSVRDIMGPCRLKHIVAARVECIKTLRGRYGFTVCQIGRAMNKDHSTICYTLRKHGDPLETLPKHT